MQATELYEITDKPDRKNVERILAYLTCIEQIPSDALDALRSLLDRAEVAESRLRTIAEARISNTYTVTVNVPKSERQAHSREVSLEDLTLTCRICGCVFKVKRYPGSFTSSTCGAKCKAEARRKDSAERQRRFRERHREQHSVDTSTIDQLGDQAND